MAATLIGCAPAMDVGCLQAGQAARWETMDAGVKQHIKSALLATLPSDVRLLLHHLHTS